MSGQLRKGTTVPRSYYGPRDYDYLCNSKLSMHAARPHTPLPQKRQALLNKKLAEFSGLGDLDALASRVPQPETVEDLPRRVRTIERVKMNPPNFVVEKIMTLL